MSVAPFFDTTSNPRSWWNPEIELSNGTMVTSNQGTTHGLYEISDPLGVFSGLVLAVRTNEAQATGGHVRAQATSPKIYWVDGSDSGGPVNGHYRTFVSAVPFLYQTGYPVNTDWTVFPTDYYGPPYGGSPPAAVGLTKNASATARTVDQAKDDHISAYTTLFKFPVTLQKWGMYIRRVRLATDSTGYIEAWATPDILGTPLTYYGKFNFRTIVPTVNSDSPNYFALKNYHASGQANFLNNNMLGLGNGVTQYIVGPVKIFDGSATIDDVKAAYPQLGGGSTPPPTPTGSYIYACGDGAAGDGSAAKQVFSRAAGMVRFKYLGDRYGPTNQGDSQGFALWDSIYGASKNITDDIMGNHDWSTSGNTPSPTLHTQPGAFNSYWNFKLAGAEYYEAPTYNGWRHIHINTENWNATQQTWLTNKLAETNGTATIVYGHRPRYSPGTSHGDQTDLASLWTIMSNKVAAYVSGHDGVYARLAPINGVVQFVVGTGGGDNYSLNTADTRIANLVSGTGKAYDQDNYGILRIDVQPDGKLNTLFVRQDGTSFDPATITATPHTTPPPPPPPPVLPPVAPVGLAIVASRTHEVDLDWTDNTDLITGDTYQVYMDGTRIKDGLTTSAYTVTGLVDGAVHNFQVSAGAPTRYSPLSATVSGSSTAPVTPPPSWVTVTPTSGTAPSTLTVTANTSGMASGVYSAKITITPNEPGGTVLSVPVTLTVGGNSDTVAPAAPTGLTAISSGVDPDRSTRGAFTFSWTPNTESDLDGTAPYIIEKAPASTGPWTEVTRVATTQVTVADLPLATDTYISVKAKDTAGNISARSALIKATPLAPLTPVTGARVVEGDGQVTVFWKANDPGQGVIEYHIYIKQSGGTYPTTPAYTGPGVVSGSSLSATVTGLTNGIPYTIKIVAAN